ncbi:Hypothetical protein LUCI_1263 [Lucifera butyrica]|uniref:Uncharacterized protein n=1 Tax=Lucifera butyrica TaxID=1351585 RepID=A0A498R706_9FIRM|nr:Hypothetical protein LUCI_1263 [Lucifera butyrica]
MTAGCILPSPCEVQEKILAKIIFFRTLKLWYKRQSDILVMLFAIVK